MIVSWNWLKDYVELDIAPDQLAHRLAMAGLNHESSTCVGQDLAIDLEVTSNRPDCLGHIGVAREIAVLWQRPLTVPRVELAERGRRWIR
jgi:phenylalanyl-tRNA synthetase beta chain